MKPNAQESPFKTAMPPGTAQMRRPLDSKTLLGNRDEVEIAHQGEIYRLRRTRQGKLILTK
jgi:hemin uptake protein HemP